MTEIDADDLLYSMEEGIFLHDGEPYTGLAREYRPAGTLVEESTYLDGVQTGPARYWYPSGQRRGEENFLNNGLHGPCKEWHPNGQLRREAVFEHSILVRDRTHDEAGRLVGEFQLTENDPMFKILEASRRIDRKTNSLSKAG